MMESDDDLADLLERELALMNDADDEEEDLFEADFLKRREPEELPSTGMDEELELLLLSANALPSLQNQIVPQHISESPEAEEPTESAEDIPEASPIYAMNHVESPVEVELTLEEKQVITDLMSLMIESVERCAPILQRSTLSPAPTKPIVPLPPAPELMIISDDSQVAISLPQPEQTSTVDRTQEISLLDNRLLNEAKLNTQAKISSTQHNDKVVWDETNRFKQALEEERVRIEERRRRREAAKLEAQREKAAEHIQRITRGILSRRATAPLKQQHLLTLQQLEAEHLHNIRRQEEALRESARREDIKNQAKEAQLMGLNESQCRKVWEEITARIESNRLSELRQMSTEDASAALIRQIVAQAKAKLHNYAMLAAQEDVEYDLIDSGSDVSDAESDEECESEIPDTPRANSGNDGVTTNNTNTTNNSTTANTSIPTTTATNTSTTNTTTNTNTNTNTTTNTTTKTQYKVAPPKTKPKVVVDPRQGRKFGGAFVNTSTTSSTADVSNNNSGDVCGSSGGVSGSSSSSVSGNSNLPIHPNTGAISASNTTSADTYTTPPLSVAERQALHTTWHNMVSDANSSTSAVVYDTSSVSMASSVLSMCFGDVGNNSNSSSNTVAISANSGSAGTSSTSVSSSDGSELIQALRHWQQWSVEYAMVVADVNTFTAANTIPATSTTSTTSTTPANTTTATSDSTNNTTDPALHNSMLDLHTHPTLLTELDLCVEGITSVAFLAQYTNLTKLTLNVNKIASLHGMQPLTQLVTLSLKDNKLTNIDALSTLHTLKFCYLDTNKITSLVPLNGLHNLSILSAKSNFIQDMPVLHCNALTRLELCRNKITTIPAYSLRYLRNLKQLDMSSNQIHTVCGETLSMCSLLQTLIFSENQLTAVPAPLRLPQLRNLRLNLNRIENVDAWVHNSDSGGSVGSNGGSGGGVGGRDRGSRGGSCGASTVGSTNTYPLFTPALQKLVLSDNHIATLHPSIFTMLPLLEELDLSFNTLPNRDSVCGIVHCKLLTALHIQDNLFTTVPVNTTTAANTRTTLPQTLLTTLLHYLVDLCPTLEVVSGNRLDPKEFSERINATRSVNIRNFYLTHEKWLEHNVKDVVYSAYCEQFRVLLQLIQAHGVQHNIMIVKERAVKREEGNSKKNTADANNTTTTNVGRDWEQENIVMLNSQLTQLLNLYNTTTNTTSATTNTSTNTTANNCVFTSYAKSTPLTIDTNTTVVVPVVSEPLPVVQGIQYEVVYLEQGGISTSDGSSGGSVDGNEKCTGGRSDGNDSFYLTQTDATGHHTTNTTNTANTSNTTTHHAAIHIQRHYRGHYLRRKLRTALQSITYHDSELDELFNSNTDEYSDLLDMCYLEEPVMVYGDHIRKRSRPGTGKNSSAGSAGSAGSDGGISGIGGIGVSGNDGFGVGVSGSGSIATSTDNWVLPQDNNNPVRTSYNVKAGSGLHNIDIHTNYSNSNNTNSGGGYDGGYGAGAEASRPDTGLSAHSIDAPDRAAQAFSGASSPAHSMLSARSGLSGITDAPPHSARSRATAAQLGQEWGISDPRVLAHMVKRSKKIRVAEDVKDRRELEKDPLYRLQQFQKTAHKAPTVQPANTRTSGSFGGAPKTMRGAGANTKRKNMPIPAWMLGQGGEGGEES